MGIFLELNNHSLDVPEPEAVVILEQNSSSFLVALSGCDSKCAFHVDGEVDQEE